jgi:sugar (pentulose or hexulose) kinase
MKVRSAAVAPVIKLLPEIREKSDSPDALRHTSYPFGAPVPVPGAAAHVTLEFKALMPFVALCPVTVGTGDTALLIAASEGMFLAGLLGLLRSNKSTRTA